MKAFGSKGLQELQESFLTNDSVRQDLSNASIKSSSRQWEFPKLGRIPQYETVLAKEQAISQMKKDIEAVKDWATAMAGFKNKKTKSIQGNLWANR
jgi:hypothetical protein